MAGPSPEMRRNTPHAAFILLLLLTLAAPAPRMAAWLLVASPARAYATARHEPQSRGRNRVASAPRPTKLVSSTRLAPGGPEAIEGRAFRPGLRTSRPGRMPPLGTGIAARDLGSTPLRC